MQKLLSVRASYSMERGNKKAGDIKVKYKRHASLFELFATNLRLDGGEDIETDRFSCGTKTSRTLRGADFRKRHIRKCPLILRWHIPS